MIMLLCENCRCRFAVQDVPVETRLICPYCASKIIVRRLQSTTDLQAQNEGNSPEPRQEHRGGSPTYPEVAPGSGSLGTGRQFLNFLDDYKRDESPLQKHYKAEQSPWVASVLSLMSGLCLGQFYNGQMLKGVCILGVSVVVQFTLVILGDNYLLMAVALALVLVGSSIDAFVSAVRLNHHVLQISKSNHPAFEDDGQPAVVGDQTREPGSQLPRPTPSELGVSSAPPAAEGLGGAQKGVDK